MTFLKQTLTTEEEEVDRFQKMVLDFHKAMDTPWRAKPTADIGQADAALRIALIDEKSDELVGAIYDQDLEKIADGLANLLYITYGCALAFGIDLEPVFCEVHKANMQRTGGPVSAEGWHRPHITAMKSIG
jgi:predicted HAD superfamily Cof-like phosphohydrolase